MAIVRRSNRLVRSGSQRRATSWDISMQTSTTINIPAASKVLVVSTAGALTKNFTVVRTRGYLAVASDQIAAGELQVGGFGIGVVTSRARAAGVASIPGPMTDSTWDGWFVHDTFGQGLEVNSAVGFLADFFQRYVIDSKAMRKLDIDEDIVFVVENFHATTGFDVLFAVRYLIKEQS